MRARIGYFRLGRQREPSERSGLQVERSRHPRREEAPGGPGPGGGRAAPLPGALRACATPGRLLLFLQTSGPELSVRSSWPLSTQSLHLCQPLSPRDPDWLLQLSYNHLKSPCLLLHLLAVFPLLKGKLHKSPDVRYPWVSKYLLND